MVNQPRPRPTASPWKPSSDPLGLPPEATQPLLQQDAFKELINKLAWCLGSTYRTPYSNKRSATREYATLLAQMILYDQGYPKQLQIK